MTRQFRYIFSYYTSLLYSNKKYWLLIVVCLNLLVFSSCGKEENNGGIMKPIIESGEREPSFSPDGELIAYTKIPENEIWLFGLATEESEYLTDGRLANWSPDGREIVYVNKGDIYKINVETRAITQLTNWGSCFFPDWHPNGRRIVFDTNHNDSTGSAVIWLIDTNGMNYKDISIHGEGEWRQPNWAPDSGRIVHVRYLNGVQFREIFIMDSSGNSPVRLTNNNVDDFYPKWSPDGSRIAYVSENDSTHPTIWLIDIDGSNKTQLTYESSTNAFWDPEWSPDGARIIYVLAERVEQSDIIIYHYHLWLMDADGGNKKQVTGKITKLFGCQ